MVFNDIPIETHSTRAFVFVCVCMTHVRSSQLFCAWIGNVSRDLLVFHQVMIIPSSSHTNRIWLQRRLVYVSPCTCIFTLARIMTMMTPLERTRFGTIAAYPISLVAAVYIDFYYITTFTPNWRVYGDARLMGNDVIFVALPEWMTASSLSHLKWSLRQLNVGENPVKWLHTIYLLSSSESLHDRFEWYPDFPSFLDRFPFILCKPTMDQKSNDKLY